MLTRALSSLTTVSDSYYPGESWSVLVSFGEIQMRRKYYQQNWQKDNTTHNFDINQSRGI